MRSQFGFIKCCERPGELFFHYSALQGGPEGFAVGQDVEFTVTREPKGERPNAVEYASCPQIYSFLCQQCLRHLKPATHTNPLLCVMGYPSRKLLAVLQYERCGFSIHCLAYKLPCCLKHPRFSPPSTHSRHGCAWAGRSAVRCVQFVCQDAYGNFMAGISTAWK